MRTPKKSSNFAADFAPMSTLINLDKLEVGSYQFDYQLDSSYFQSADKSEVLGGDVACNAKLDLRERDFDLTISVNGTVQVTCDRCLDAMDIAVNVTEDVDVEQDTKELDLNWLAYELIVVNLPLVHRHPDGECNPEMEKLLQSHLCSTSEEPEEL